MDVDIQLSESSTVNANASDLIKALSDIPATLSHFPKLKPVTELAPNRYEWDLETIGAAGVEHDCLFATDFHIDLDSNVIKFTAVPGHGNAQISGQFTAVDKDDGATLTLEVGGIIGDVKVPMLLRGAAKPFIKGIFEKLTQKFIERIHQKYV